MVNLAEFKPARLALCLGAAIAVTCSSPALSAVMTYNGFGVAGGLTPTVHSESGITMATDIAGGHFDIYGNTVGGTPADNVAAIHHGNNGERVRFTFATGKFDLNSIEITGWLIRLTGPLDVTFTGSNGASHTLSSASFTGVLDFTALGGWTDLDWVTLGTTENAPGTCSECSIVGFDNVNISATSVAEPLTLGLFGLGLAGLGLAGHRRAAR